MKIIVYLIHIIYLILFLLCFLQNKFNCYYHTNENFLEEINRFLNLDEGMKLLFFFKFPKFKKIHFDNRIKILIFLNQL